MKANQLTNESGRTALPADTSGNPEVFVNLTYDAGFKAVFADKANKELLIGMLNLLLPDGVRVRGITKYLDREQTRDTLRSKRPQLDLICEDEDGRKFLVEFQRASEKDFFQRCVYYGAGAYHIKLDTRQKYASLRPVYVVSLLNFCLPMHAGEEWNTERIVSHYGFVEMDTGTVAPPTIMCIFAELGRFTKSEEECRSDRAWLFYLFRHSSSFADIPPEIRDKPFVTDLLEACRLAAFPKDKKILYDRSIMNEIDILAQRDYAVEEGYLRGKAEGMEDGKRDIAAAFLKKGLDATLIASCTGLSVSEVEALK